MRKKYYIFNLFFILFMVIIIILYILFNPYEVKAESFNFYPNITNFGGVYSFNNNGSSVTGGRYATSTFYDTSDYYAYSDIGVYNYQTNGVILNFNLSEPLEKDNRYVMSFYFGANTNVIKGTMPNFVRPITNITDSPFSYPSNSVEVKSSKCTSDPGDLIGVFGYSSKCLVDFVYKGTYEANNLSLSINLQNKGNALVHVYGYNMQKMAKDYTTELNIIENSINNFNNSLNQNKQDIVNNANQNTIDIINNQEQNKQDIINGVNENFQTCRDSVNLFDKYTTNLWYYGTSHTFVSNSNVYSYIANVEPNTTYTITNFNLGNRFLVLTSKDKPSANVQYSRLIVSNSSINKYTFTTDSNEYYVFFGFYVGSDSNELLNASKEVQLQKGSKATSYEEYGKQVCSNKFDETNDKLNDVNNSINNVNDSITDSNVDSSSASGFFNNFSNNDHGLSGIVSSPLRLVKAFTSNTCTPAKFDIYGKDVELPCSTYLTNREDVKPFYIAYNIIMGGLISYGCLIGIRKKVDDFKNPDDSKVEVMDL